MIISEKLVVVKQNHICLECQNAILPGSTAKVLVNYNRPSKLINSLYICRDCLDRKFHENIEENLSDLPSNIIDAYREHLRG